MYSIIRAKKLKSIGAIARSARHSFREQPTPNADAERTPLNKVVGANSCTKILSEVNNKLPQKRRRDAVLCIEYLVTASPEAFSRHGGYLDDMGNGLFKDALKWLRARHGAANVVSAVIHLDESTPHLVAYALPVTKDGRLSARQFLGGSKVLSEMQDSFHAACGAPRGLLRGVQGSKAKHDEVSKFYKNLASTHDAPLLSSSDYAAKAIGYETGPWKQAQAIVRANAQAAVLERRSRKSNCARIKTMDRLEKQVKSYQETLRRLGGELEEKERDLIGREAEVAKILPALEVERAHVNMLRRVIEEQQVIINRSAAAPQKRNKYLASSSELDWR